MQSFRSWLSYWRDRLVESTDSTWDAMIGNTVPALLLALITTTVSAFVYKQIVGTDTAILEWLATVLAGITGTGIVLLVVIFSRAFAVQPFLRDKKQADDIKLADDRSERLIEEINAIRNPRFQRDWGVKELVRYLVSEYGAAKGEIVHVAWATRLVHDIQQKAKDDALWIWGKEHDPLAWDRLHADYFSSHVIRYLDDWLVWAKCASEGTVFPEPNFRVGLHPLEKHYKGPFFYLMFSSEQVKEQYPLYLTQTTTQQVKA